MLINDDSSIMLSKIVIESEQCLTAVLKNFAFKYVDICRIFKFVLITFEFCCQYNFT